jgi:uncharacterized protein (DUF1015 family)
MQLLVEWPVGQGIGQRVEGAASVAPGVDGAAAHSLDELEDVISSLLADDVAENPAEQPDVRAQGSVFAEVGGGWVWRSHRRTRYADEWQPVLVPRFESFPALRYSPATEPLDVLVAPPYDVMSPDEVANHAARSAHNIVHVDVPAGGADRYTRAAALLRQWVADGVLTRDETPSFTLYRTQFNDAMGVARDLVGVIGALEVVDDGAGGVLPHERTTPKASTDRLDLTRATRANLSPVWGLSLADGLTGLLQAPGELVGEVTVDDVVHRVERVTSAERIAEIAAAVSGHDVLIADGHHRYGVARIYRDEVRDAAARTDEEVDAAELTLAFVGELVAEQLSVEAIHRLYTGVERGDLETALAQSFDLTTIDRPTPDTLAAMEAEGFLVLVGPDGAHRLTPKPGAFDGVRALDGAWLENALDGVPAEVTYQHGLDEVLAAVDKGDAVAAVLIRPVSVAEIERTAREGLLMPPKSTFFTPKLRTGFVIRELSG